MFFLGVTNVWLPYEKCSGQYLFQLEFYNRIKIGPLRLKINNNP